jgi:hypothetical protein
MTQAGWPWQIRVTMGGTLHCHQVIPGGAYRLQDKKTGKDESNPWNTEQLWRFYA